MDEISIELLLEDLKSSDEMTRQRVTQDLWQIWFQQKGAYGLELLGRSQSLLEAGAINEAEDLLTEIIGDQPDFAEAWNRRAVLYFLQKRYRQSLADCEQVIALNPVHFGAIHGQGLCYMALGNYSAAIQAFRRALEIQPYAIANQRLLLECMAKLS